MAVSLEQVCEYLEKLEFKFSQEDKGVVITGISRDNISAMLFIRTKEDGGLLTMQMEPINEDKSEHFNIPSDSEHINLILPQLLKANYETKFGTWEYDPRDGDLRFAIEIPFEDAVMTYNQFHRIMGMFFTALDAQKNIMHTFKTGEVLEDDGMMEELLKAGLADKFMEFLKAEAAKSDKKDDDGI